MTSSLDLASATNGLSEAEPGFWCSPTSRDVSFPEHGHAACLQVEDSSFWFAHRSRCLVEVVRRFPPPGPILEIGSGNGFVTRSLREAGFGAIALEPGESGARNALDRGLAPVVCSTFEDADFLPSTIPAIGLFDVLEHIPNDEDYLRLLARHLIPEGRLYVAVPAHTWLWSDADVEAAHARRYARRRLLERVSGAGFEIEYITAYFTPLVFPILLGRAIPYRLGRRQPETDRYVRELRGLDGFAGRTLARLLDREARRLGHGRRRFGASYILVVRRGSPGPW